MIPPAKETPVAILSDQQGTGNKMLNFYYLNMRNILVQGTSSYPTRVALRLMANSARRTNQISY
jgi:hypothetical protein